MSEIKEKAKELCEKSGCHHKCHDTKDCVVEDEALLLITENKSNNYDFKSNKELFKQALVEGVNRRLDRDIEEAKKIEQIEEMAKVIDYTFVLAEGVGATRPSSRMIAMDLYDAGYRKQSEWISVEDRLPDCEWGAESEAVLFITKQGFMYTGYYGCGGVYRDRYFREYKNSTDGYDISSITHWMPLPEAPKMKGGE